MNTSTRPLSSSLLAAGIALAALTVSACAPEDTIDDAALEPAEELAERSAPPTTCSIHEVEDEDGEIRTVREFYVFDAIDEKLDRDEDLRDFTGMDRVETCDGAREFVRLEEEYLAQLPTPPAESAPSEDFPVEPSMRIAYGSSSDFRPSVHLVIRQGPGYSEEIGCTGFIIGPREIVTAAHCIYQDGWRPVKVTVRNGGSNECVANCDDSTSSNARGYRHPSYTGGAGDDVGLFVLSQDLPWPANHTNDRIRMMISKTWQNAPISVYGWGRNTQNGGSGVSREGTMTVSWSGSKHFTANANWTRACKGDSGGPAVRTTVSDFPLAVGVESQMAGSFGAGCPYSDGFNRWAHIGPKVPWIESKIGRACNRYTSASNAAITYARCW